MSCSSLWSSRMRPICTRSEEHTSELQSPCNLVCRLLLEKKKTRPARILSLRHFALRSGRPCSSRSRSLPEYSRTVESLDYRNCFVQLLIFFFFNDTATTEIYTLSLHDALPI